MNTTTFQWIKLPLTTAVAAVLGLACCLGPQILRWGVILIQDVDPSTAPLFPTLWAGFRHVMFGPTLLSLFFLGLVMGALQPKFWWLVGAAAMALLPLAVIIEGVVAPKSHNLAGLEIALYTFMALPSLAGAFLGSRLRLWLHAKNAA